MSDSMEKGNPIYEQQLSSALRALMMQYDAGACRILTKLAGICSERADAARTNGDLDASRDWSQAGYLSVRAAAKAKV